MCVNTGVTASNTRGSTSTGTVRPAKGRGAKAPFMLFIGWFNHHSFKKDLICVYEP